jgi:flagellar hook-length control protein FliK
MTPLPALRLPDTLAMPAPAGAVVPAADQHEGPPPSGRFAGKLAQALILPDAAGSAPAAMTSPVTGPLPTEPDMVAAGLGPHGVTTTPEATMAGGIAAADVEPTADQALAQGAVVAPPLGAGDSLAQMPTPGPMPKDTAPLPDASRADSAPDTPPMFDTTAPATTPEGSVSQTSATPSAIVDTAPAGQTPAEEASDQAPTATETTAEVAHGAADKESAPTIPVLLPQTVPAQAKGDATITPKPGLSDPIDGLAQAKGRDGLAKAAQRSDGIGRDAVPLPTAPKEGSALSGVAARRGALSTALQGAGVAEQAITTGAGQAAPSAMVSVAPALPAAGPMSTAPITTAPVAPAPIPMMQTDWPASVANATIAALTPEGGTLILDLTPEDLGALRVTLTIDGDTATVRFQTDTPEAARMLADAERQLSAEFARNGVTLSGHSAQSDRHGGHAAQGPGPARALADDINDSRPDSALPMARGGINLIA